MARPGPKPIGTRIEARVPDPLVELLREHAATRDQKLAAAVREALERGVAAIRAEEEAARRTA